MGKPAANIPMPPIERHHKAAWLLNLVIYFVFFVFIAPIENWADMLVGWRFGKPDVFLTPFTEGKFYGYAIFLSAQSMFIYFLFRALLGRSAIAIFLILANLVVFAACFLDYATSYRLVLPSQQAGLVGNQIIFSLLSIIFGCTTHHHIASRDKLVPILASD